MNDRRQPAQLGLFGGVEPLSGVGAAAVAPEVATLAERLPSTLRLGGSTWSFPGWAEIVYDRRYPTARLAREGLAAYARHPLLRGVGLDRSFYQPLSVAELAAYAEAVPPWFRFLVKAHEDLTLPDFPDRARYGTRRGLTNPRYLDPAYAAGEVVAPFVEGLGEKGGALLFQFPPRSLGGARFPTALHRFLTALPRGPVYAVELRRPELLSPDYAAALADAGACHCLNVHPTMPDLVTQASAVPPGRAPALVVRWLVRPGMSYAAAGPRFAPFDRLQNEDPATRRTVAALARKAAERDLPALVTINNLAEGCGPLSVVELAREIVGGAG